MNRLMAPLSTLPTTTGSIVAGPGPLGVVLSVLYLLTRRVLRLVALSFRSRRSKDLEIVVLRHELAVLRRQVAHDRRGRCRHVRAPGRCRPGSGGEERHREHARQRAVV